MRAVLFSVMVLCLWLGGCAAMGPTGDANDPYESTNREVFSFNQTLDRSIMAPSAHAYNRFVSEFARERVHDLLANFDLPITFANDILQGEAKRAGQSLARFGVNSTIGLGGLFDPATSHFAMPNHREDFGQTLGVWGVEEGPYLVLPVLGPDPPRDIAGQLTDIAIDPITWTAFKQHFWWLSTRQYLKLLDLRARNIDSLRDIERSSVDFYASTRSLYRQFRANEIRNGAENAKELPDF